MGLIILVIVLASFILPFVLVIFWHKRPIVALVIASVIAIIVPFMAGMIQTFQAMMIYGTGDPQLMANGIRMAVSLPVFSLFIIVPLLAFVQWVSRKLRARNLSRDEIKSAFE